MFRRVFSLLLLLLVMVPPALAKHDALASQIEKILAQPDTERGFWGIEVVSLKDGRTLYALNADKLFTPASNTKLFVTAAALALIGPDYRFKTTVETTGTVDKYGRLIGDLVLVGRGDPNLSGRVLPYAGHTQRTQPSIRVLEQLADQLVQ
ncbi:MAG: D-alanyl-D-alanine carboxypeptidase, partial [Terriglobales bacterium]